MPLAGFIVGSFQAPGAIAHHRFHLRAQFLKLLSGAAITPAGAGPTASVLLVHMPRFQSARQDARAAQPAKPAQSKQSPVMQLKRLDAKAVFERQASNNRRNN